MFCRFQGKVSTFIKYCELREKKSEIGINKLTNNKIE